MFDTAMATRLDTLEAELRRLEAEKSRLVARQLDVIFQAELAQAPLAAGCRNMREWLAGRADLTSETAGSLVGLAERISPRLLSDLGAGDITVDRAVAESKLETDLADGQKAAASRRFDCDTVNKLAARHRRHSRLDELAAAHDRYLAIQPSLDYSAWRLHGLLPGTAGAVVEEALRARADSFPTPPLGLRPNPGQLRADALVAISQDSLDGNADPSAASGPTAVIFVDAALAAARGGEEAGERGAEVAAGVRVGPGALEELLCTGRIGLTLLEDGRPLQTSPTAHAVAPALRRFIYWRDHGVCTADGCQSRYRLQPHHITAHHRGGPTSADNLTLLCWYHHHIVIHTHGYHIDPTSPPHRRRFQPAHLTRPPP